MDVEVERQALEVFEALVELPAAERSAQLARLCADDPELRRRVSDMLELHETDLGFLAQPALGTGFRIEVDDSLAPLPRGTRIGPWELRELLGSGGMGTVYGAVRADDARRRPVALKLIKRGMDSAVVLARFRRERQVLEALEHPGIARLLQAGTTDDGAPYLVMELVDGDPIDRYADRMCLGIPARLALFAQVCRAVEFAHRQLVLHRDLKPANILVTRGGQPKLLDFGIAKLLHDDAQGRTATVTSTAGRFLTPEYASPEQVRGEVLSPRSDVYSLGVVLYELLSGHRPYRLTNRSAREVERILAEQDPPRPSQAVGRTTQVERAGERHHIDPEHVSRVRDGDPARLREQLCGDLDTIVMMALRKEPERRYASARELAEDLERQLTGGAIHARRATLRYRTSRFVSRHTVGLLSALLVLVVLGAGGFAWWREQQLRDTEQAAERVGAMFLDLGADSGGLATRAELRRTLQSTGADELAEQLRQRPEQLAQLAQTVAQACERVRDDELALVWRRRHLDATRLLQDDARLGRSALEYARSAHDAARFDEALESVRQARQLLDGDGRRRDRARAWLEEAEILWSRGDLAAAGAAHERTTRLLADLPPADGLRVEATIAAARHLRRMGAVAQAEALLRPSLRDAQAAEPPDPLLVADVQFELSQVLWLTPRFRDTEVVLRRALVEYQRRLSDDDPRLAQALDALARVVGVLREPGSYSQVDRVSFALWRRARDLREQAFGAEGLAYAGSLETISLITSTGVARALMAQLLELYGRFYGPEHPLTLLAQTRYDAMGAADAKAGRRLVADVEQLASQLPADHWRLAVARSQAASSHSWPRADQREAILQQAAGQLRDALGPDHPEARLAADRVRMAQGLPKAGRASTPTPGPWPRVLRSGHMTGKHDERTTIDFEDDHLEKILHVPAGEEPPDVARVWIHGMPYTFGWSRFRPDDGMRLQVNGDPQQVLAFDAGLAFNLQDEQPQWVPFEIPVEWLRPGPNVVAVFETHDPDYEVNRGWEYNNLHVSLDLDVDDDQSWWWGYAQNSCCVEMQRASMAAPKPLRPSPLIEAHRAQGYAECRGELMIGLELEWR